jgi:hypothetical protein
MTRKGIIPGMEKDDEMSWKGLYLERTWPEMLLCVERTDPIHDVCSNRKNPAIGHVLVYIYIFIEKL